LQKLYATTEAQLKALTEAVAVLNAGKSCTDVCAILSKFTAFKKQLTTGQNVVGSKSKCQKQK
jgi:hypothetical protein